MNALQCALSFLVVVVLPTAIVVYMLQTAPMGEEDEITGFRRIEK